jgi:murein hydrolase activator
MSENNRHLTLGFTFVFCLLLCFSGVAQNRTQLEKQKSENLKKIKEAEAILKETETEKTATLGQLNALNRQIEVKQKMIRSMNQELKLLDSEISQISGIVEALEKDLADLKEEYAAMIYAAYKASKGKTQLGYLFSSKSFNQFARRIQYMAQYSEARRTQVRQIETVKELLISEQTKVSEKRNEKKYLLDDQLKENNELLGLKKKQTNIVSQLTFREKEIKKDMADRQKSIEKLDKLISDLIKEEIAKSKAAETKVSVKAKEEIAALSSNFDGAKKKLPWPVSTGFISGKFGIHAHPVFKNIQIENMGVDIQTSSGEKVLSVFDGQVTRVSSIPGMNNVVVIQHGEYRTVYARMKTVQVKAGQTVKRGEVIGEVYTDKDGNTELQFQVWKGTQKQDPAAWLSTR